MSTVQVEVFEAFKSVGIAPDIAMKAAAALNESRDTELSRVEGKIDKLDAKLLGVDNRVIVVETKMTQVLWILAAMSSATLGILLKVLTLH
jgi:hypothetical protein